MNKNTIRGLAILVAMIIIAVLLWRFLPTGPQAVKPGPAGPTATTKLKATPSPTPGAKQAAQPGVPAGPPIQKESPTGVTPLQEPGTPAPKITILPAKPLGEKWGILVGNYARYPDAARMLARLKKRHQPAFVQRNPKNLKEFQVWLGPFSSREEAQKAEKALKSILKKPHKIQQIETMVPK